MQHSFVLSYRRSRAHNLRNRLLEGTKEIDKNKIHNYG